MESNVVEEAKGEPEHPRSIPHAAKTEKYSIVITHATKTRMRLQKYERVSSLLTPPHSSAAFKISSRGRNHSDGSKNTETRVAKDNLIDFLLFIC